MMVIKYDNKWAITSYNLIFSWRLCEVWLAHGLCNDSAGIWRGDV